MSATLEKNGVKDSKMKWGEDDTQILKLSNLVPDRVRVRIVTEKDSDVLELAESIKKHGVMQPIIVRSTEANRVTMSENSDWFVVAGNRRVAAARVAGLKTIPAIVLQLTDEQARELSIVENVQRQSMNAIDEAVAINEMARALQGQDAETVIASMLGKPLSYVHAAQMLLKLPAKMIVAIREGKLPVRAGHLIARVDPKYHEKLCEFALKPRWDKKMPTLEDLQSEISSTVEKELSGAWFPKDKPYAGRVACTACPLNTANANELFGNIGLENGKCGGPVCFNVKQQQALADVTGKALNHLPKLKFRGAGVKNYSELHIKGWKAIGDIKYVKAEQKQFTNPETHAIGIVKPTHWEPANKKPYAVVLKKPSKKEADISVNGSGNVDYERQRFVRSAEERALFAEIADKPVLEKHWRLLLSTQAGYNTRRALLALGLDDKSSTAQVVKKLSAMKLEQLAFFMCVTQENVQAEKLCQWFGIDGKPVAKKAADLARKEYDAKKGLKSAAK